MTRPESRLLTWLESARARNGSTVANVLAQLENRRPVSARSWRAGEGSAWWARHVHPSMVRAPNPRTIDAVAKLYRERFSEKK